MSIEASRETLMMENEVWFFVSIIPSTSTDDDNDEQMIGMKIKVWANLDKNEKLCLQSVRWLDREDYRKRLLSFGTIPFHFCSLVCHQSINCQSRLKVLGINRYRRQKNQIHFHRFYFHSWRTNYFTLALYQNVMQLRGGKVILQKRVGVFVKYQWSISEVLGILVKYLWSVLE